jgi:hypothetical protein
MTEHLQTRFTRTLLGGAAAVAVGIVGGCGTAGGPEAGPIPSSTLAAPAKERPYCIDGPGNQAMPVGIVNGRLVGEVHAECVGNPNDPVGAYQNFRQEGRATAALKNGAKMIIRCYGTGDSIRTDAAGTYTGEYPTSSDIWFRGTIPGNTKIGEVAIPRTNMGFLIMKFEGDSVASCTPQKD